MVAVVLFRNRFGLVSLFLLFSHFNHIKDYIVMLHVRFSFVFTSFLFVFSLLASPLSLAGDGYQVVASKTITKQLGVQRPIDLDLEVNGVRLSSVFFDKNKLEAFLILQNRTPERVTTEVGIGLFDRNGRLVATGIDASGFSFSGDSIDAGGQKNVKLAFPKFINEFSEARTFQLVFTIIEAEGERKSYRSRHNVD
ncbi:MAG: hypothetical protein CSB48_03805 [Proteobacteria bacterium]|nr:MAG: hypothetical protein CSB48_03805 [Pseudomonadota bacterium]